MENSLTLIRDQQKESWNKFSKGWKSWDNMVMDFLSPMGKEIVRLIHPSGEDIVLDVAAGTGEPGLTIAGMLSGGKVISIDLSEDMLSVAKEKAVARKMENFETKVADVTELPYFTDKEPINGNNYYRLKQMDIDNQFQYSKIIKASFNDMGISFKVYPNPVANALIIKSDEEVIGKKPIARLFDSQGKLLKTFSISDVSQSLNTSLLRSGVYTIIIDLKNEKQHIQFIKE